MEKFTELVTCPYCGNEEYHTFQYGENVLYCYSCEKEFAIEIETEIKVKSTRFYDKICAACDEPLFSDEILNGKCPKCSCTVFNDNEFKYSKFNYKGWRLE